MSLTARKKRKSRFCEPNEHLIVDGKVLLSEVNDLLGSEIEEEELDTIGGWLYSQNPALKEGSQWHYNDLVFTVLKKDKHRVRKMEIVKHTSVPVTVGEG
jgi:CBS domain containing-hemolysin-like protein